MLRILRLSLLHGGLEVLILLDHLFQVAFTLECLFELEFLALDPIFLLLNHGRQVCAKILIAPRILGL